MNLAASIRASLFSNLARLQGRDYLVLFRGSVVSFSPGLPVPLVKPCFVSFLT
jgi:hypothetical protein